MPAIQPLEAIRKAQDMTSLDKDFMVGEHVLYRARLHWMVFLWPLLWFFVGLLLILNGIAVSDERSSQAYLLLAPCFLSAGVLMGSTSLMTYRRSEFRLTTKRLLVKVGFIHRHCFEVLLPRITRIQIHQGILGRVFDYGSVTIIDAEGPKGPFHRISAPLDFRRKVEDVAP